MSVIHKGSRNHLHGAAATTSSRTYWRHYARRYGKIILLQVLAVFMVTYYCIFWFEIRQGQLLQTVADSSASSARLVSIHTQKAAALDESERSLMIDTTSTTPKKTRTRTRTLLSDDKDAITNIDNATAAAKATVAYITSVTACPEDTTSRATFLDLAAVLKHSIHLSSIRASSQSAYDYAMFAFLHPNATACQAALETIGYRVLLRDTPVTFDQVQNPAYRRILFNPNDGCCGEKGKAFSLSLSLSSTRSRIFL